MKNQIMGIYDIKAKIIKSTFIMTTVTDGIRAFSNLVKRGESDLADYPHDFTLHHLGTIDMETGHVEKTEHTQPLANGSEFSSNKTEQEVQA